MANALLRSTKVIRGQHFILYISLEVVLLKLSCCIIQIQYSNETLYKQHKVSSRLPVAGCRFESATGNWLLVADSRIGNRQLVAGCRFKNASPYRQPLPRPYPNPTPVQTYTDPTLPYPTQFRPDPTRPDPSLTLTLSRSYPTLTIPRPSPGPTLPYPSHTLILKYLIPNQQPATSCRLPIQKCKSM